MVKRNGGDGVPRSVGTLDRALRAACRTNECAGEDGVNLRSLALAALLRNADIGRGHTAEESAPANTIRGAAKRLGLSKPAIVRAASKLERMKLAKREDDPTDMRSKLLFLTARGERFVDAIAAADDAS